MGRLGDAPLAQLSQVHSSTSTGSDNTLKSGQEEQLRPDGVRIRNGFGKPQADVEPSSVTATVVLSSTVGISSFFVEVRKQLRKRAIISPHIVPHYYAPPRKIKFYTYRKDKESRTVLYKVRFLTSSTSNEKLTFAPQRSNRFPYASKI